MPETNTATMGHNNLPSHNTHPSSLPGSISAQVQGNGCMFSLLSLTTPRFLKGWVCSQWRGKLIAGNMTALPMHKSAELARPQDKEGGGRVMIIFTWERVAQMLCLSETRWSRAAIFS